MSLTTRHACADAVISYIARRTSPQLFVGSQGVGLDDGFAARHSCSPHHETLFLQAIEEVDEGNRSDS